MMTQEEKEEKGIDKEQVRCKRNIPTWLEDDGEIFICKFCRKFRPTELKSKTKPGKCKLCTSGE